MRIHITKQKSKLPKGGKEIEMLNSLFLLEDLPEKTKGNSPWVYLETLDVFDTGGNDAREWKAQISYDLFDWSIKEKKNFTLVIPHKFDPDVKYLADDIDDQISEWLQKASKRADIIISKVSEFVLCPGDLFKERYAQQLEQLKHTISYWEPFVSGEKEAERLLQLFKMQRKPKFVN